MNITKWIEGLIAARRCPVIPIMTHPGIELLGRNVLDAVTNGRVHAEAIEALNRHFPQSDACTIIMDLTVEAEAFGAKLYMSDHEVPSVVGRLVTNATQVKAAKIPNLNVGRIPEFLKACRLASSQIDKPVFGGCIGPYSLAGRLFDMTEIMMAIYTEPDTVCALLEKCTTFLISYCQAIKETGAAGVIIAEPAAGLLSDDCCREYSSIYVRRIVDQVQDDSFAIILHNCGNTGHCTSAMLTAGARGYHFGNQMDMTVALAECPQDVLVMGNLDPVGVFKMSTPGQVSEATRQLLERCGKHPNFVLSSGCDTPPEVPFANIEAFYKALECYNRQICTY